MHKLIKFFLIIFFSYSGIYFSTANAATINAASCSQADVQSAINSANDGDTVSVPAGNCAWTDKITITDLKFVLRGAGIDKTTVTCGNNKNCLYIKNNTDRTFRITGFTFDGSNTTATFGIIVVEGIDDDWRIDNNKFANLTTRGVTIGSKGLSSNAYGIIDHNTFIAPYNLSVQSITVIGSGAVSWSKPYTPGTANAVYIEDNTFTNSYKNDTSIDTANGARVVARYNIITGTSISIHGMDTGNNRSPHTMEIYNNTFDTSYSISVFIRFRGSTGVIFDNTATGDYRNFLVTNYRSCTTYIPWGKCDGSNETYDGNEALTNGSGTHDGGANKSILTNSGQSWTAGAWIDHYLYNTTDGSKCKVTGNTSTTATCALSGGTDNDWDDGDAYKITLGYPCGDSVGRTTGQVLEPLYEWNNTLNGSDIDIGVNDNCPGDTPSVAHHLTEGVEFYNDTQKPGYTPYIYPHPLAKTPSPPIGNLW